MFCWTRSDLKLKRKVSLRSFFFSKFLSQHFSLFFTFAILLCVFVTYFVEGSYLFDQPFSKTDIVSLSSSKVNLSTQEVN